jgi:hypothetical protein
MRVLKLLILNSWTIFQRFKGNPKRISTGKWKNPITQQISNIGEWYEI